MGTTAEKLNYLKETKSEIKNALETPSNIFRDYPDLIKKYIDNQPTKVASDGICSNAVDLPAKAINVYGNSEQETTKGINLWAGLESYTITATRDDYYIYFNNIVFGNFSEDTIVTVKMETDGVWGDKSGEDTVEAYIQNTNTKAHTRITSKCFNFECQANESYILRLDVNQKDKTHTFSKIMIVKGSYTEQTIPAYEPYTGGMPSPSPEYPQEIETVGSNVNFFDGELESGSLANNTGQNYGNAKNTRSKNYLAVEENTTYALSDNINGSFIVHAYDKDKNWLKMIGASNYTGKYIFTTPTQTAYIRFRTNETDLTAKIKLEKGSTITPYSPPGMGSVEIDIVNKNLFDNTLKGYGHYGTTAKTIPTGVRLSVNTDVTASDYIFGCYAIINLLNFVGKTVRMKAMFKSNSNLKGSYTIGLCNSNGANRAPKGSTGVSEKEISFVIPSLKTGQEYLGVWFYANSEGTGVAGDYVDYTNVIITIDNEDITYEPYHEPKVITIDLQGNTLGKVGDVKDILKVNRNGEVEIKKNIGKVVLTGEEVLIDNSSTSIRKWWGINFSNYGIYQYNDPTKVCDVLTTKFKPRPQQGTFLPKQVALTTKNKNMYFVFEPDTTEEQARAILTDMPVYFRLAEPQTIKLSSISPIELWQGTNIFKLITNLDTTFEVEYIVNKDSVLNEVQTAMLEAEIEI